MVPTAGVEPARLSALPPQDSVSANSTTSAKSVHRRGSGACCRAGRHDTKCTHRPPENLLLRLFLRCGRLLIRGNARHVRRLLCRRRRRLRWCSRKLRRQGRHVAGRRRCARRCPFDESFRCDRLRRQIREHDADAEKDRGNDRRRPRQESRRTARAEDGRRRAAAERRTGGRAAPLLDQDQRDERQPAQNVEDEQ